MDPACPGTQRVDGAAVPRGEFNMILAVSLSLAVQVLVPNHWSVFLKGCLWKQPAAYFVGNWLLGAFSSWVSAKKVFTSEGCKGRQETESRPAATVPSPIAHVAQLRNVSVHVESLSECLQVTSMWLILFQLLQWNTWMHFWVERSITWPQLSAWLEAWEGKHAVPCTSTYIVMACDVVIVFLVANNRWWSHYNMQRMPQVTILVCFRLL